MPIADLRDSRAVGRVLASMGLTPSSAHQKAATFSRLAEALLGAGIRPGQRVEALFVPGRIEVLGKHTDYAGGRSLVAAADRGFCLLAVPGDGPAVEMTDAARGQTCRFDLRADLEVPAESWFNYPMTVGRRLARNFAGPLRGGRIVFDSDLPPAAGMSSSSAMIVATFLAIDAMNRLSDSRTYHENVNSREDLAAYLAAVENGQSFRALAGDRGVGTSGGSEDHTAILCCRAGAMGQYSYCPVRFERAVPVPDGYGFAVASSGVVAEKTGAAMQNYNLASRLAGAVAELWRRSTGRDDPHIAAALASAPDAAERMREILQQPSADFTRAQLLNRFEHLLAESEEVVPAAGDALARGDMAEFGLLVDRSQGLAESLLGNQVPQTVFLARSARELGAAAASAFGAGFGGSVWALVREAEAEEFLSAWRSRYAAAFPEHSERSAFFLTHAGPGAVRIA
ncbi:MAG TPA: galactokinase family protein [Phycisphaerae bacterium]|nr:galactokinase family protein [Phycisphaerae bacterium]